MRQSVSVAAGGEFCTLIGFLFIRLQGQRKWTESEMACNQVCHGPVTTDLIAEVLHQTPLDTIFWTQAMTVYHQPSVVLFSLTFKKEDPGFTLLEFDVWVWKLSVTSGNEIIL